MSCPNPAFVKVLLGTFAGFAFVTTSALAGETATLDARMQPILANYLKIQSALAADSTEGIEEAATSIANDAPTIDVTNVTSEHAEHYRHLPTDLQNSAKALARASSLDAARDAFKQLSRPMAMWGSMSKPAGIDVMYCSMANGSWLQKHGDVRNPYYGKSMLACGEVVGGAGHPVQPTKQSHQGGTEMHTIHGGQHY